MAGTSELARPIKPLRTGNLRSAAVYGLALHTTGSGIVEQARKQGKDPLEHAVAYYTKAPFFPHYVIGWDGTIVQICDEGVRAQHIGFAERALYLSDAWEAKVPAELVKMWKAAWPGYSSPASLFPGPSPNNVYVGAEMLPLDEHAKFEPAFEGSKYTLGQHQGAVMLGADIADRYRFKKDWARGPQLVGHESVNPIKRPGWDPGELRKRPWFNMAWVRGMLCQDELSPLM